MIEEKKKRVIFLHVFELFCIFFLIKISHELTINCIFIEINL